MKSRHIRRGPLALKGLSKQLNRMVDDIKAHKPLAGFGTTTTETTEGIPIHAETTGPGGGGGTGGGGTVDVADSDGGEVDNVTLLRFEITDPDTEDFLRIADNGGGEAIVKIPTTTVTGAVNGAAATLVVVTDGEDWDPI